MEKVSKKIFNCEICEKSYTTNKCKKNHIDIVHGKVKKFTCDVCSSSFGFKFQLTIHIENNHKGGKYECKNCGKVFVGSGGLAKHIKAIHGTQKSYICDLENYSLYHQS